MKKFSIQIILMFCAIYVNAQDWINYNPFTVLGTSLSKICCVDASTAYAVGRELTAFKTTNGGEHWDRLNTETATDFHWNLNDVAFINSNIGFAVGQNGTIIRTIDGGDNWVLLDSKTTSDLNSIQFVDDNTGFVTGNDGIILKTTNRGDIWTKQISWGTNTFTSISFSDANTGYIAGGYGNVMKTTNGGDLWLPLTFSNQYHITGIYFIDSKIGFITCSTITPATGTYYHKNMLFKTTDGGQEWNQIETNFDKEGEVIDAWFADETIGYLLDEDGKIYKTIDGGVNWTKQVIEFGNYSAISFIDANSGFIVGSNRGGGWGKIFKTQDAGINWENKTDLCTSATCISFADANNGYIIASTGEMLKTIDKGITWNCLQPGIPNEYAISDMIFNDINTGYAVGSKIYKTIDGGHNWSIQNTLVDINSSLIWICFPTKDIGYAGGYDGIIFKKGLNQTDWMPLYYEQGLNLNSAFFIDQNIGYVVGQHPNSSFSKLLKTIDGGNTWAEIGQEIIYAMKQVYFTDSQTGYLAGDFGVIYKTTDAGQSWVRLTSEYNYQFVITSIYFSDANTGYVLGFKSDLSDYRFAKNYKTTDAGKTWTTYKPNIAGEPILTSMIFTNSNSGYAIGYDGLSNGSSIILRTNNIIETGIGNINLSHTNVEIYPNPANDIINIKSIDNSGNSKISIYSLSGIKLIEGHSNSNILQVNINFLPDGVYVLKVIKGNEIITKKFVKH